MTQSESRPKSGELPAQTLDYPGRQSDMAAQPDYDLSNYRPAGKLINKVAIITGGDSGIGQAVAISLAMEGADVAILYNENDDDAVSQFGAQSAMQRPGQPEELAPAYVLLASSDGSFMTGSLVEVVAELSLWAK